ncbi:MULTISPECIES: hypothetical protein [unclassified Rhodanobacter]|uniref:hypothetical protein n=1 Tax=unclassified Rhodanobacter TaxID=2621553 RepID=UPI0007A9E1C5|nr:hypothetical protein [Rhodanobacter sp. FW510-R10]KZC32608.1 hypothetical protein RhoFW510R10_11885 [Rhodanobacter sp. FW510-R10]
MHPNTRRILEELQTTYARAAASYRQLIAISQEADTYDYESCPIFLRPFRHYSNDPSKAFRGLARRTADQVVSVIRVELAGAQPLELTGYQDILGRYLDDSQAMPSEEFSCIELGEALHEAFADRATTMVLSQAAERLVRHFDLSAGAEPVQRRGCIVLALRMHLDSWGGRLTYSNDRTLVEACRSLQDVVQTIDSGIANRIADGIRVMVAAGNLNRWAPERHAYGPIGPIELRAYQQKVEFLIPLELAAQINAFLSEHAPSFRSAARRAA